jgi:hypothetical protein
MEKEREAMMSLVSRTFLFTFSRLFAARTKDG